MDLYTAFIFAVHSGHIQIYISFFGDFSQCYGILEFAINNDMLNETPVT